MQLYPDDLCSAPRVTTSIRTFISTSFVSGREHEGMGCAHHRSRWFGRCNRGLVRHFHFWSATILQLSNTLMGLRFPLYIQGRAARCGLIMVYFIVSKLTKRPDTGTPSDESTPLASYTKH